MFRTLLASLIVFTSCATVHKPEAHLGPRVAEPLRSQFIMGCVMSNIPVTACLCFEEMVVKYKGPDIETYTQLDMAVAQQQCMQVLTPILDKELEELMKKFLEQERKESV
jgi:nitrogenase subunit NifH